MRSVIQAIRHKFHPLHHARKSRVGRAVLRAADRPSWISVPSVHFRVRGQLLSHGLSYGLVGSQERNPSALALACLRLFAFRSFWDVGANFGYYSWLLKSAAPDLKILLVEPLPINAKLIRDTMRKNRLTDVSLIEAAASDHSGIGVLHADTLSGSTSSLNEGNTFEQRHFGVQPKAIEVPLTSIDTLRQQQGPVDFMKIDVEGHEAATLRGAADTVARDQPILFIECDHPGHACLAPLKAISYEIVDADTLNTTCSEASNNFFCFPRHRVHMIDVVLRAVASHGDTPVQASHMSRI